ncbi:MAG: hypothetical protein KF809_07135 [Chloroflexi bacterium]|nr:hypothetical protein [Chloroflexota bacterium]
MTDPDAIAALLALPVWPEDPLPAIRTLGAGTTVVALDDDPTGTQTVTGVPVLTRWDAERLRALRDTATDLVYLLTNSRSMDAATAASLATDIGRTLRDADPAAGAWAVISRSDSTLRGHFPGEVDALVEGLRAPDARVVLAPYFGDGGRLTIGGRHHLRRGDELVPVERTEFARDAVFGYGTSDLTDWVAERCAASGAPGRTVALVALDAIRRVGPDAVTQTLLALPPGGVLAVDSAAERDIEVVALGVLHAERAGLPVVARSAASYVRARAGRPPSGTLPDDAVTAGAPGLIVVGSHVPTTTAQLERLLAEPPLPVAHVELPVERLRTLSGDDARAFVAATAQTVDRLLDEGTTPVVATSRELVRGADAADDLRLSAHVSALLVDVVRAVSRRPAWVLAKGGITSSDVATHGLGLDEAWVVGPIAPGVPLWRSGPGGRWPGLLLTVFPGNVGDVDTVRAVVARLAGIG